MRRDASRPRSLSKGAAALRDLLARAPQRTRTTCRRATADTCSRPSPRAARPGPRLRADEPAPLGVCRGSLLLRAPPGVRETKRQQVLAGPSRIPPGGTGTRTEASTARPLQVEREARGTSGAAAVDHLAVDLHAPLACRAPLTSAASPDGADSPSPRSRCARAFALAAEAGSAPVDGTARANRSRAVTLRARSYTPAPAQAGAGARARVARGRVDGLASASSVIGSPGPAARAFSARAADSRGRERVETAALDQPLSSTR